MNINLDTINNASKIMNSNTNHEVAVHILGMKKEIKTFGFNSLSNELQLIYALYDNNYLDLGADFAKKEFIKDLVGYCDKITVIVDNIGSDSIESLGLSVRAYNCLKRANVNTIEELCKLSLKDIACIRNIGKKSYSEIVDKVKNILDFFSGDDFILNNGEKDGITVTDKAITIDYDLLEDELHYGE